jgi:hypothetical protein
LKFGIIHCREQLRDGVERAARLLEVLLDFPFVITQTVNEVWKIADDADFCGGDGMEEIKPLMNAKGR